MAEFARAVVRGQQAPQVKVDLGGNDAVTGLHFAPPGDDSQPLPGDPVFLVQNTGSGNAEALGYQDAATDPKAGPGDKRIYSRSGPGVMAAEVWLKNDGSILVAGPLSSFEMGATGLVTVTTPLGTFGADTHMHNSPFGPTTPPIPGT